MRDFQQSIHLFVEFGRFYQKGKIVFQYKHGRPPPFFGQLNHSTMRHSASDPAMGMGFGSKSGTRFGGNL
jgi:hypothetical protein